MTEAEYIAESQRFGRDNSRTPMQWSGASNAGFTTPSAKPWLAVHPNYPEINAAKEETDANSVLHNTRQVIALHNYHLAFVYGDYMISIPTTNRSLVIPAPLMSASSWS